MNSNSGNSSQAVRLLLLVWRTNGDFYYSINSCIDWLIDWLIDCYFFFKTNFLCCCQILMLSFFWAENRAQKTEAGKFKISEWVSECVSEWVKHGWCGALDCLHMGYMEPSLFCGSFFSFWYLLEIWGFGFGFLWQDFCKNNPHYLLFSIHTLHSTLL